MPDPLHDLLTRGYRYAMALCGDPALADDLVQDAWVSVTRAGGPHHRGYLFRAIRTRWIDAVRKPRLHVVSDKVELAAVQPIGQRRVEDRTELVPLLAALRPEEREALFLCVVEGYTAAEAGELLGKPRNTVLSLLHRARGRVRGLLEDEKEAL